MRIPLDRQQGRSKRRPRRTFESEIAQPSLSARRKSRARRVPAERSDGSRGTPTEPGAQGPQRENPSRNRWRLVLARLPVAFILIALIILFIYVSITPDFFVSGADVLGNRHVAKETVYQASGTDAQNIFWIQPRRAAESVAQLHGIKSARVRCRLPAQVTIEVTERQPLVLWRAEAQGMDWWLDEEGVVLPYHGIVSDTVFVVDSSERQLSVGDRIKPDGIVTSVQQLASSLPEVSLFYYQPDRGLSFMQNTVYGSWPVYVGDSSDLTRKIQVLQAFTEYFVEHKMRPSFVDVRWADYPVFGKPGRKASLSGD